SSRVSRSILPPPCWPPAPDARSFRRRRERPPNWAMHGRSAQCDDRGMTSDTLTALSNAMADAVAAAAPSVVQVQGRRRPASGLVSADGIVVTPMRAIGREDGLQVRRDDGTAVAAELAGWDPTTTLAVLRVPGLAAPAAKPAATPPRVGQL